MNTNNDKELEIIQDESSKTANKKIKKKKRIKRRRKFIRKIVVPTVRFILHYVVSLIILALFYTAVIAICLHFGYNGTIFNSKIIALIGIPLGLFATFAATFVVRKWLQLLRGKEIIH